ncbi:cadmium-translocating P-type ATPase [Brevibacillus ruminantium]|uniref:Cadmium-translocating P-type ATPase n=1 Tax=Brevibacillus ruminantium TaxID=2950604 RepID=A0ABY4WCB9_9BACL|nr:heavy metal translocating P-type ATPase [Brevibacillus ruminantium]USG63400.1 cadmium-translocating P-type ATPase [Brevibacillus ruminantium]
MNQSLATEQTKSVSRTESKKKKSARQWIARYAEGLAALISGVFLAAAWTIENASHTLSIWLYVLAFAIGGFAKAKEGFLTLTKEKDLDVNLLMIVAAIGAASIGYWAEGAVLIFIFSLSGALEAFTMERSSRDISALMELKPEKAILYRDGKERLVTIEELQLGDLILVKPGERIPADGVVKDGYSSVNQASITGESVPVDKVLGDDVYAGTLNGQGALFIEVTKTSESTLFSKIIRLVQEAQSEMPKSQRYMERFQRIYARVIIAATLVLILVPHYALGWTWDEALYKAMVFLVVASPCALVASIMPAMLSAISNCARKGLLFKGGAHLEKLAEVKVVAFDKTGTLTYGRPEVTDMIAYQDLDESKLLFVAATVEKLSTHPIAKAIVQKAGEESLSLGYPADFQSYAGWGVEGTIHGEVWRVGKPGTGENFGGHEQARNDLERLKREGKTVVSIHNEKGIAGIIALQDSVRPEVKQMITHLKKLGIQVAMLTGDQQATADAIAKEAGIDLVYAELLPEDKVKIVKKLRTDIGSVAMVGDGINDAPALATASVGIAMGAAGSDAALETSDLVLMNDDLKRIEDGIVLGRRMKKIIVQNMVFAALVIAVLMISNFAAGIPLPLGVVGHEGSTILVILNGLRLLR